MAVMCLVRKRGEVHPRVKEYIRGNYGTGEHEGSHSYKTYLKYILGRDTWGDYPVELAISIRFQAKLTIVNAPSLAEVRIRHDSALEKADLILLYIGITCYTAVSE